MTTTPRVKKTALELRLSMNHKTSEAMKSARRSCVGAYELGGAKGVLWITLCRDAQGLYTSLAELDELLKLQKLAMDRMESEEQAGRVTPAPTREREEASHSRIVERAKADSEAEERRFLERCAGQSLGSPRKIQSECKVIRPSDSVAEKVLAEMAAQGPSPLLEDEESTPEINEESGLDQAGDACIDHPAGDGDSRNASTEQRANLATGEHDLPDLRATSGLTPDPASTRAWSTNCKGEVGERLGGKIDKLLHEIRNPAIDKEDEQPTVDPPAEVCDLDAGGNEVLPVVIEEVAGQTPLQSNGTDQFGSGLAGAVELNRSEAASTLTAEPSQLDGDSAWGLLCPVPEFSPADLQELVSALDQHAEMASISLVAAITRAKLTLRGISPWTAPDAPLQIGAGDLVVLLRSALRGVR